MAKYALECACARGAAPGGEKREIPGKGSMNHGQEKNGGGKAGHRGYGAKGFMGVSATIRNTVSVGRDDLGTPMYTFYFV